MLFPVSLGKHQKPEDREREPMRGSILCLYEIDLGSFF